MDENEQEPLTPQDGQATRPGPVDQPGQTPQPPAPRESTGTNARQTTTSGSPAPALSASSVPVFAPIPDHHDGQEQSRSSLAFTPFEPQTADAPGFDGPLAFPPQSDSAPADAPQADLPGRIADNPAMDDMDRGLARVDPLAVHPRLSSRILCVVFGLLLLAAAAGMWWLGVRTANGQNFDDEVWLRLNTSLPSWLQSLVHLLAVSSTVIAISVVSALVGIVVAAVRKRWWLLGQLVVFAGLCYGSSLLKGVLPRPYLQNINSSASNTAPSGHTLLAAAAVVVLVCAVPRAWRAACAAVGSAYTLLVALSLVAGKWHRPTDVVMSLLIVGGWALLVLACTRTSGMDEIGTRSASASIQIVGSVMITGGIMISLYGAYLVWQIEPGLSLGASWTQSGACAATTMLVCGVSMLVFGLVLAMRQLTASPLTKLGLVGAPPAPPSK